MCIGRTCARHKYNLRLWCPVVRTVKCSVSTPCRVRHVPASVCSRSQIKIDRLAQKFAKRLRDSRSVLIRPSPVIRASLVVLASVVNLDTVSVFSLQSLLVWHCSISINCCVVHGQSNHSLKLNRISYFQLVQTYQEPSTTVTEGVSLTHNKA